MHLGFASWQTSLSKYNETTFPIMQYKLPSADWLNSVLAPCLWVDACAETELKLQLDLEPETVHEMAFYRGQCGRLFSANTFLSLRIVKVSCREQVCKYYSGVTRGEQQVKAAEASAYTRAVAPSGNPQHQRQRVNTAK